MNKILFTFLFLFSLQSYAQDTTTTIPKDTIKVTKSLPNIYIDTLTKIKSDTSKVQINTTATKLSSFRQFEIGAYGVYSVRTLTQPSQVPDEYFSQLNSGWGGSFDIAGYFNENHGMSFSYTLFLANASMYKFSSYTLDYFKVTDDFTIHYSNLNYVFRTPLEEIDNSYFRFVIGGGVVSYNNEGTTNGYPAQITGMGPSLNLGLFLDIKFVSLGFGIKTGYLPSYELTDYGITKTITPQDSSQEISLGLVSFMAGFRFGE